MTYKFELFLVIQKKMLINIKSFKLSLPLILYSVTYIIMFFFNDLFILNSSFSTLN